MRKHYTINNKLYILETICELFVSLLPNKNLSTEEIIDYCKKNLTGYKIPKFIEFIDEIPKSNVGKILRRELRKRDNG